MVGREFWRGASGRGWRRPVPGHGAARHHGGLWRPRTTNDFIQELRDYFSAIKSREGVTRARQKFSASRAVTAFDASMSAPDKKAWLDALDLLEAELLGPASPENPSDDAVRRRTTSGKASSCMKSWTRNGRGHGVDCKEALAVALVKLELRRDRVPGGRLADSYGDRARGTFHPEIATALAIYQAARRRAPTTREVLRFASRDELRPSGQRPGQGTVAGRAGPARSRATRAGVS